MAKEKNTKATAKAAPAAKSNEPEFKFGVADLAEILDIEPASARVALRKAEVEKAGRSYGWNTKAELDAVAKQLQSNKGAAPAEKPKPKVKAAGTETAKPKAKAAAPVAKAKVKKAA